jgi:plasmid stabilization system protein ParE
MTVTIRSQAHRDISEALQFYLDEETPHSAERFAGAVDTAYDEIIEETKLLLSRYDITSASLDFGERGFRNHFITTGGSCTCPFIRTIQRLIIIPKGRGTGEVGL